MAMGCLKGVVTLKLQRPLLFTLLVDIFDGCVSLYSNWKLGAQWQLRFDEKPAAGDP